MEALFIETISSVSTIFSKRIIYRLTIKIFFLLGFISMGFTLFGQSTASIEIVSKTTPRVFAGDTASTVNYVCEGSSLSGFKATIINNETLIHLNYSENGTESVKIEYQISDSAPSLYTQPFSVEEEGKHKVTYKWFDPMNHPQGGQFSIIVDGTSPIILANIEYKSIKLNEFSFGSHENETQKKRLSYPVGSVIHIMATDFIAGVSEINYRIDDAPEQIYRRPIKLTARGRHSLTLHATDKVGNETISEPIVFEILAE